MRMGRHGDVLVERAGDRLIVRRADTTTEITTDLLREIVEGRSFGVEFGEGVMWFGTEGEGCGRVGYVIDDPRFADWLRGRIEPLTLTMERIT